MEPCTPLERLRKPKIFNMSIFDWVTSLLAAWLIGLWIGIHGLQWPWFLLTWVLFGVAVHYAFGIDTMLGYYLGLNLKPDRIPCI